MSSRTSADGLETKIINGSENKTPRRLSFVRTCDDRAMMILPRSHTHTRVSHRHFDLLSQASQFPQPLCKGYASNGTVKVRVSSATVQHD